MKKIETNLEKIINDIAAFYDEKVWLFVTLNGVKIDETHTQIQWIFSRYFAKDDIIIYYSNIEDSMTIPSITHIIPSAIISQREIVDMFGIKVEDTQKGLYLDEDSITMPLSNCGI